MSAQPLTVIACDIGGVIKDQLNDVPIQNAIESIMRLSEEPSNRVILISKCKESYKQKSNLWLEEHNLSHIRAFYCLEYEEKLKIANDNHVNIMIDDKMQVLRTFPSSVIKIWFCTNPKNIEGAKKFQPEFINSVRIAQNWNELIHLLEELKS